LGKISKALEKSKQNISGKSSQSPSHASVSRMRGTPAMPSPGQQAGVTQKNISPKTLPPSPPSSRNKPSTTRQHPGKIIKPQEPHGSVVAYHRPHSPEAEQFRMLKTAIMFPNSGTPPRTIMITSSAPGEGKSFVAANLATSIANGIDEYVLLMDCDLRLPTLHRIFKFPDNTPGLTEYLTRGAPLASLLRKTIIEKLTLLPCGTPPPNPSELISSDQMRRLLQEVRSRYPDRYIIIDAPPPDVTAEANALARQVDGIVIVVKTGYSKKNALKEIVETYGRKKILGVVKNYAEKSKTYHYG